MVRHKIELYWDELEEQEFPEDEQEIVRAARVALKNAFAPYSGYHVGSAVLCRDGSIYTGQNVEDYCYSLTAHSEQVALHNANNAGKGDQVIKLACLGAEEGDRHVAPCGQCLTIMAQYEHRARQDMTIIFGGGEGKSLARVSNVKTLQPLSFAPHDLEIAEGS